jgi:hypothetical protein
MLSVHSEDVARFQKPIEELFTIALENAKKRVEYEIKITKIKEVEYFFVFTDSFFSGTIFYELKERNLLGEYGVLIAFPTRHTTIIYQINDVKAIEAVNTLTPMVHKLYHQGPGSNNSNLYWFNKETLIDLPINREENRSIFTPSSEFVELLNKLAEPK